MKSWLHRIQFLYWGRDAWVWPKYHKWSDPYNIQLLDYSLLFGPFELRVWHKGKRPLC